MKKIIYIIITLIFLPLVYAECDCTCEDPKANLSLPEGHCNISLTLKTDKDRYKNEEKITIFNELTEKKQDFTIEYWIEDIKGEIIKEKTETKNTNKKQFTPKLTENTTLVIKNNLTYLGCKNIIVENYNKVEVFIEVQPKKEPELELINYSKKLNLSDELNISLMIYSGDNINYSIAFWIDNITKTEDYKIDQRYKNETVNLSIKIPNNCSIESKKYDLIIKSQEKEIKKKIDIENNCKEKEEELEENTEKCILSIHSEENNSENIINQSANPITGFTIYESTTIKSKEIAKYLLMIILASILVFIITINKGVGKAIKEYSQKWSSQLEH